MTLSLREQVFTILANQELRRADTIVVLEGDGNARIAYGAHLYRLHLAPIVIASGGVDAPPEGIAADKAAIQLISMGVVAQDILIENVSQNTREQAVNVVELVEERQWKALTLVVSPYHQYRAYLTFLKRLQERGLHEKVRLYSAPVRWLPWYDKVKRMTLLAAECQKLDQYSEYVASFEEALAYLLWLDG